MKADELWEKHNQITTKANFLAALQEYGELVKAEAVKVCESKVDPEWPSDDISMMAENCGGAIKEMKLP